MTPRFALILAAVLVACGAPPAPTAEPQAATVTLDAITAPARPGVVASRVAPPPTIEVAVAEPPVPTQPPFDCQTYVNGLTYQAFDPEPTREAYRITASCRGWDQATIAKWEHFIVDDVIAKESAFCWNVRGGATLTGNGCELARQGTREDSGWFQTIGLWWRPGGPLCELEGYCSSDAIIASPWASMNSGLLAVEINGSRSWCFSDWARAYHPTCATTPRNWP